VLWSSYNWILLTAAALRQPPPGIITALRPNSSNRPPFSAEARVAMAPLNRKLPYTQPRMRLIGLHSRGPRIIAFVSGLTLVTVVAALGWRALDDQPDSLDVVPLLILAGSAIITLRIVAAELQLIGHGLGVTVPPAQAVRITVIGTVFNLLPLPGAAATRMIALSRLGASKRSIARALLAATAVWIGAAFILAGIGIGANHGWLGVMAALIGVVGLLVGAATLHRAGFDARSVLMLVGLEVALTIVGIIRLWLALRSVEVSSSLLEAGGLAVAAPASAAVGFMPGGLGIREGLAAGLGSLSGVGAAEASIAAVIDRCIGLIMLVPMYLATARSGSFSSESDVE
jgi:uncharacterized membrane protein YbhN (UPF0104 family)